MIKTVSIVAFIALVIFGGWEIWLQWDKYNTQSDIKEQEAAAALKIEPTSLQGMPYSLEQSYKSAEQNGAVGMRNWLKAYGPSVGDPRRAWIELDYMVLVAHSDPVEAKKIFADVKSRIGTNSPIFPRIKTLEKTYD
jgi:hypothetical protein